MSRVVLIVDQQDARRRALCGALSARGIRFLEAPDAFHAMAALGRADFGAVVACEEKRHLSLRGLCMLACKRHPGIRLFVLLEPGTDARVMNAAMGVPVECVAPDAEPASLADRVAAASSSEVADPFDVPTTSQVVAAVTLAQEDQRGAWQPRLRPPPASDFRDAIPSPAPANLRSIASLVETQPGIPNPFLVSAQPLMEGHLDDGSGMALLMALFAQELTGRLLIVDGEAHGTLFMLRGEPVWADAAGGDAELFTRLLDKGIVPPHTPRPPVGEGELLGTLTRQGLLTGETTHKLMREGVRDRVLALCSQAGGNWRFVEDRTFLDTTPLLRLNPFGLMMESLRRGLTPDRLLAESHELAGRYVHPGPALKQASSRIGSFIRGRNAAEILDGTCTVATFCEKTSLDVLMGTLVVMALARSRLVTLADDPLVASDDVALTESVETLPPEEFNIPLVDVEPAAPVAGQAATWQQDPGAREEILSLYASIKPLNAPREILGLRPHADLPDIAAAFERRMRMLDELVVNPGPDEALLNARLDELRRKYRGALETLQMQLGGAGEGGGNSNPF